MRLTGTVVCLRAAPRNHLTRVVYEWPHNALQYHYYLPHTRLQSAASHYSNTVEYSFCTVANRASSSRVICTSFRSAVTVFDSLLPQLSVCCSCNSLFALAISTISLAHLRFVTKRRSLLQPPSNRSSATRVNPFSPAFF